MARPGASRPTRALSLVALGVGLSGVLGGGWWMRSCRNRPTPASIAQRAAPAPGRAAPADASAAAASTASLTIVVRDGQGPLRDASVRLTPREGEIVVVKTGADGVARADRLAPGSWRVSASADGHVPAALPARQLAPGSADRVALRLASGGRTLRGTVSDTSGGPVAGARVEAARLGPAALPEDAVSTASTAGDGTYRMTVADGALWVAVASDDYAPQSRRVDVGPAGAVADFSLVPGGVIEGVVVDERTRGPVAGATVRARRTPREWAGMGLGAERRTIAGPGGRFRLTGLKPGDWQLEAAAPPRYSLDTAHVGLAVGEQISRVELRIGATPALRGRVVDELGGPAPGVHVHAVGRSTTEVGADAAGSFAFEGLRPGGYVLSAESPAYLHAEVTDVWLTDRDIDGVVVHVQRGLVVKGHVEPRQVCRVQHEFEVVPGREGRAVPESSTGPDGEFALGPFDSGPATLIARCPTGDQGELRVQVAPGASGAVLAVTAGASLAGRVIDGAGAPVQGVSVVANAPDLLTALASGRPGVRFRAGNGLIASGDQALTDAMGAFQISGLPPGAYGFQVLDRGEPLQARGAWPVVQLAARDHQTAIELAVERARGVITGTVTGPGGAPVPDAWISAYPQPSVLDRMNLDGTRDASPVMHLGPGGNDPAPPPVLSDAQGHYQLTGLFHVEYTLIAEAQRGQLRARQSGIVPDATVNLQTEGVSTLSGTASGPAGPARVFTVTLLGPTMAARSVTDGTFVFDHIHPGSYTVHAESLLGGGLGEITVAPGAAATIDVALSANGTVAGALVDATGKPAGGMKVVIRDDSAAELIRPPVATGPDGGFRIDHAPGTCYLVVLRPAARPFIKPLTLEPGKLLELGPVVLDAPPAR